MLQQLVLIVIALLYLQKKSVSALTYEHVAFLLLLAYLMRQSFRVEHLSSADGFTTDIDKEAYTNLHKIVSELYKNDTLTIPGHVHIQGNLQVGEKGDLNNPAKANTNGKLWTRDIGTRNLGGNIKINDSKIDLWSGKTGGANGTETITIHPHIHCNSIQSNTEVHAEKVKTNHISNRTGTTDERNPKYWLHVDSPLHVNNRLKMPWLKDNSRQGRRKQEHGEVFRDDWNLKMHK